MKTLRTTMMTWTLAAGVTLSGAALFAMDAGAGPKPAGNHWGKTEDPFGWGETENPFGKKTGGTKTPKAPEAEPKPTADSASGLPTGKRQHKH